jgi:cell division protein ZapA
MRMESKVDQEVLIFGKAYTISGYENKEYFQKIANYLNHKKEEFSGLENAGRLNADYMNVQMQINLADDYFKAMKQVELLEEEIKAKEKEVYDLKHELITNQIKQENTEKSLKKAQEDLAQKEKEVIRLEAKLEKSKK